MITIHKSGKLVTLSGRDLPELSMPLIRRRRNVANDQSEPGPVYRRPPLRERMGSDPTPNLPVLRLSDFSQPVCRWIQGCAEPPDRGSFGLSSGQHGPAMGARLGCVLDTKLYR